MIYLDHAATTAALPEVCRAMEPYMSEKFGNASATYELGEYSRLIIEQAREKVAKCIGARPSEIYFTSGGSESDNWVIKGIAGANKARGSHIITSKVEHHAVLNSCDFLEKLGYKVTYLDVDKDGVVDLDQLKSSITSETSLITIMFGNNEIGTLEPIIEIGKIAREYGITFHTDAVQVVGQLPIDVRQLPIDLMSASAHKFHGPKGVGFLYVRKGVSIPAYIHGGAQENGKRAGTENVAGMVGLAEALMISCKKMNHTIRYVKSLRDYFVERVMKEIPDVIYNGHRTNRLPGNANFSFGNVDAAELLILLEEDDIYASAGSACSSGLRKISHVIDSIGVPQEYAYGTIRFTLGSENTRADIDKTIETLKKYINLIRQG